MMQDHSKIVGDHDKMMQDHSKIVGNHDKMMGDRLPTIFVWSRTIFQFSSNYST
jgi:hypothetical protein